MDPIEAEEEAPDDEITDPARHHDLATRRRHEFEVTPAFVEFAVRRAANESDPEAPCREWDYHVVGHGWAYTGKLDAHGQAKVQVAQPRKARYRAIVLPPVLIASAPPRVEISDPGLGPAAQRRRRSVAEIINNLSLLFKK